MARWATAASLSASLLISSLLFFFCNGSQMRRCLQREAEAETCGLISDKMDGLQGGTWFLLRKVTRFQSKMSDSVFWKLIRHG